MQTEARWYRKLNNDTVQCTLCPHLCILKNGKSGLCRVRSNKDGHLMSEVYGTVSSLHFDPIEKKPLYHFFPGSTILSLGTFGCNMRCTFCQNFCISQTEVDSASNAKYLSPEQIIETAARNHENAGIAFTYNEPVVWYEYMFDIAKLAKRKGLKTVMVTNGFINPEPLKVIMELIDAFSVDLKAFTDNFYTKVTSSKLDPVKESLKLISLAGKHLEIVNLVIPGLNDDEATFSEMTQWIARELGKETVLHISRYFPDYTLNTEATPLATINKLKEIAEQQLTYVYTGNVGSGSNDTLCRNCHSILISRHGYTIHMNGLTKEGNCKVCGNFFS